MSGRGGGRVDVLVTGTGGQGIVLASRLLAQAHLSRGDDVRVAETIGMAQRGGSVTSHVRTAPAASGIATAQIPLGGADLVLGFEPGEAARALPYLADGGVVVTAVKPQRPVTASLAGLAYDGSVALDHLREHAGRLVEVDGDALARAAGSPRSLNVVLLGAALASGVLGVTADEIREAIAVRVKPRYVELNLRALDLGLAAATGKEAHA